MLEQDVPYPRANAAVRAALLRTSAALIFAILLAACRTSAPSVPDLVRLVAADTGLAVRMTLVAAPGARINARVKPVLEFSDGSRVVFDSPSRTSDSAYYASPPEVTIPRRPRIDGVLRVGVCPAGLEVCQALTLPISMEVP